MSRVFSPFNTIPTPFYIAVDMVYGVEVVNMTDIEKIGIVDMVMVRSHARALYIPLSPDLVRAYELKKGDQLKVKIVEVRRAVET